MYLEKVVINGFKSFAEETEFIFDHSFVSIVGPNGSGKTNVADAMRWVMGEQSLKLMRMKKATDAIFAGSDKRSRLGMAQVDLHINNHDGRLHIDYPEVVISRRLTRDGETEYLINKSKVRLQDILLLLAQANFGQKSYGVIGQGMITDIVNANPQDRKDFFDEATGVKEFQIKRDQAINKLIRTEDNLQRVEDLLVEIEPRLRSLKRQVEKLDKRQRVEEHLAEVHTQYYGSSLVELTTKLTNLKTDAENLRTNQTTVHGKLTSIENEIDAIGKEESRTELYHRLQKEHNDIIQKKNDLLRDQAIIKGRLELEHERSGEIDLLWSQRRLDDITKQLETIQGDIVNNNQTIEHQATQLVSLQKTQATVDKDVANLQKQVSKVQEEISRLVEVLSVPEIKRELESLFQKQEQFLRELLGTTSLDQFKKMQKHAQDITTHLADLLDKLHEERDEDIAVKKQELKAVEQSMQSTVQLKEKLLQDSTTLHISIEAKREKNTLLQTSAERLTTERDGITAEIEAKAKEIAAQKIGKSEISDLQAQSQIIEEKINALETNINSTKASLDEFNQAEENKKQRLLELQTHSRQAQTELNQITNKLQAVEIEIAKLDTRRDDLRTEISREVSAETQVAIEQWTELRNDHDQLRIQIEKLQHQLELIGGIDAEIVQEYEMTNERYEFLKTQSEDMRDTIESMEGIIDELDETIKRQFNKSFKAIAKSFTKYFHILFDGGKAELEILTELPTETADDASVETVGDEIAPVTLEDRPIGHNPIGKLKKKHRVVSGIDIIAQPPGKKLQSIQALSGGEKSMTAIALICAIIDANTPPFVVLDEVEAALDEANSEKFSAIVKQLAGKTQFIIITHNRATMHQADVLYGVTMNSEGVSHILSVKMTEAEKMLEAEATQV